LYHVEFTRQAARDLRKLGHDIQRRIRDAIDGLKAIPRPPGNVKLKGQLKGFHRVREGDYRIVYAVDDPQQLIRVARIRHRKEVY
jgi:mRNA interferase RelE/StbE